MAGRKGLTETGMVRKATPLVLSALAWCPQQSRVAHELPIGQSIADMVLLKAARPHVWPEAPLTVAESIVLSTLRQLGTARADTIGRRVFMNAEEVRALLNGRLSEWRLVKSRARNVYVARATWVHRAEMIAVEAKLTRWRQALEQATFYRRYADRAFVLLPRLKADLAVRHESAFRDAGVGLMAYDTDGVTCIISSNRSTLHSWHREYALSRV